MSTGENSLSGIKVVFEDDWLLAVSKPAGLLVHAGARKNQPNLQDMLNEGRKRRLTLFHRLDQDTSGIVLLGKRGDINAKMSEIFEGRRVRKAYLALVAGAWPKTTTRIDRRLERGPEGRMRVASELQGQTALTTFRMLASDEKKSFLEILLKTGRTHQIRVHCASEGHAVLGDTLYGGTREASRGALALHAYKMELPHPATAQPIRLFDPPPQSWVEAWLDGDATWLERIKRPD